MTEPGKCPHCGEPLQVKKIPKPYMHGWVGCPKCGVYKNWNHDPEDAIRTMNKRAGGFPLAPGDTAWFVGLELGTDEIWMEPDMVTGVGYRGFMISDSPDEDPEAMDTAILWEELGLNVFATREEAQAAAVRLREEKRKERQK